MANKRFRCAGGRKPVTPCDLKRFHLLSSPQIAPHGDRIAFVKKHVGDKNQYVTNLWMIDVKGSEQPKQFTSGDKDGAPRWSPSGSHIAFVSGRSEHRPQLYLIDAGGGEAKPMTNFPEGAIGAFTWSPDGMRLAVSFRSQDAEWTEKAKKERQESGVSTPPRVIDDLWYRLDGDGYFNAQRHHLYLVDFASGEHRELYAKDTLGDFTFDFSPDGTEIVVATNRDKQALIRPWKSELLRIDVTTGKTRAIPNLPPGPKTCVRWSPDGKRIAYAGREGKDDIYGVENLELYVCDPRRGKAQSLTASYDVCLLSTAVADMTDASFEPSLQFRADGTRVDMVIGTEGQVHVASVPVEGGKLVYHTRGNTVHELGSVSDDGKRIALTVGSPTRLAEIAVAACRRNEFSLKVLTRFNDELLKERELSEPVSHWVEAEDGHRVQVWSLKPNHVPRGKQLPAVLQIHGGPHAQYGCGFFHEFQVLASAGYCVFYGNPRGSKGYGRDHCAPIRGDWGGKDWLDIQAISKFMKSQSFVDSKRAGIMGGSYGGYMTNWAIAHGDDFRAAITERCVSNLVSMSGNSDFPMEPDHYFPGNFWDRPEQRWRQSPIAYFGNVTTPTLIIHSEGDLRCNVEQSEQVFTALKLLQVPCRFVRYPASTSHGMSRQGPPDLRIHRLDQIVAWWEKYLKGTGK